MRYRYRRQTARFSSSGVPRLCNRGGSSPRMSQLQDYLRKTVLETYFARLLNRPSRFQNTVIVAEMKGVLSPQRRRLEEDIESVKKRILDLSPETFFSTPEIDREGLVGLERRSSPGVGPPEGMTQEQLSILNLDATGHLFNRVSDYLANLRQGTNRRRCKTSWRLSLT